METVLDTYQQVVHSNATVTASGSSVVAMNFGHKEVTLVVNVTVAPTGTTPSITYSVQEVDPGNGTTVIGSAKSGTVITGITTQTITLPVTLGGDVIVTWTVTGTTPSFTSVYATLVNKGPSPAIYDQAGNGPVAVKAASTAVAAGDPSLAVGLSPNSPLPAGTNVIGALTANQSVNLAQVGGTTIVTGGVGGSQGVGGLAAAGAAVAGNPVLVAGSDGTDARTLSTDASGRQIAVGGAAPGAVPVGNPVYVAGSDGTDIRALATDTSGRQVVVGAGAAGAPVGGIVSTQVPDTSATGALGALNANVQVNLSGSVGVGFQLAAGTLVGTIVGELSFDGGTTWNATYIDTGNKLASIVFGSANAAAAGALIGTHGAGLARIRVSAFTSGTANITLRASQVGDPVVTFSGTPATAVLPPAAAQVGGSDGANLRTIATDTLGLLMTGDFPYAAAVGRISGSSLVNVVGRVLSGSTGQLMLTTYTEQTSAATRTVASSSASDTSAGTGAQQVTIVGYDGSMNVLTEVVTMNGTSAVTTANAYRFLESVQVTRSGTGGSNAGTITISGFGTLGFGNVTTTGDNQTFWGHHYIRAGKTLYLLGMSYNFGGVSSGQVMARYVNPLATGPTEIQVTPQFGSRYLAGTYPFRVPVVLTGPGRLRLFGVGLSNFVSASFEGVEF